MHWKGFFGLVIVLGLTGCSRKPESPPASPASAAPALLAQSALVTGDAEGLRSYLRSVEETPAKRFDVEWNPDVVAVDRASALRSLRGLSPDGATFRFVAGDPAFAELAPGRILFLWGIAVRRVRAVQTVDDELVVTTTEVSLSEMFRNANIEIDYALRPQSPLVVPHVQAPDAPEAAPAAANRPPRAGGFMPVRYAAEEPPAPGGGGGISADPPAPADPNAPRPGDTVLPLGLDSWGVKDYHGFDITAKYGPAADGIAFELQARLAQPDLNDDPSGPDQGADKKAGKSVGKDFSKAEEDQRKKTRDDIRANKSLTDVEAEAKRQEDAKAAAKSVDKSRKDATDAVRNDVKNLASIIGNGSGLWDLRIGASGKIKAAATNDTLRVAGNIVIKDSALALMRTDFNHVSGQLALFFIARRGEKSEQWISKGKLKVELPIRFNIPVIVGGLPLMFQVAFNFIAQPALTTKNDSFTARYEIPFNGNATVTYDKGKVTTGGTMQTLPQVLEAFGNSIGVSAILIAVQAPRLGLGLGLFSASSVGYIDLVSTFTITSGGDLGMFHCRNHQLVSTVNAGIDTQIALPLDGWAKMLGKPLNSTFEEISKAASVRQQVYKKEWYRNEPAIKACELK
ncbi:MAG: hypothetical protein ABI616_10710 [Pseudomonadota bacterium]